MSGYVAGQARIPVESAPKMGGASDVTFVWEPSAITAGSVPHLDAVEALRSVADALTAIDR